LFNQFLVSFLFHHPLQLGQLLFRQQLTFVFEKKFINYSEKYIEIAVIDLFGLKTSTLT